MFTHFTCFDIGTACIIMFFKGLTEKLYAYALLARMKKKRAEETRSGWRVHIIPLYIRHNSQPKRINDTSPIYCRRGTLVYM